MRIWDLEPRVLCRQHLLGEHRELHGLWNILTQDKRGYRLHPETRRWEGKLAALYRRHDALVIEMARRGYGHNSPLDERLATGAAEQHDYVDTPDAQRRILVQKGCECMIDEPVLRPYTAADEATCLALFDTNVPDAFSSDERAEYLAFLRALPGPYFVLEQGGRAIGCGGYAAAGDGKTADLCWGMIDQALHHRGLGALLLQARIDRIVAARDATAVALKTVEETVPFFRKFGFELTRVVPDGVAEGRDRYDLTLDLNRQRPKQGG